ncbi:MAG TPA: NADH-quinone oxidoreductase subunit NuoK [Candidatus Saccharimonadales bacterium]|nr:NADH-quinone oxidoreductase subunit NuoK [Candidatus Saccharimonadales bacterium]
MTVPIYHVLAFTFSMFLIGVIGALTRRNAIIVLMSIELMLNSANINFIVFSRLLGNLGGQVFSVFVIVTAAAEVAVGLAIILSLFRNTETVNLDDVHLMKG